MMHFHLDCIKPAAATAPKQQHMLLVSCDPHVRCDRQVQLSCHFMLIYVKNYVDVPLGKALPKTVVVWYTKTKYKIEKQ